jgi:hypothetical protein
MAVAPLSDAFVVGLLHRLMGRHRYSQVYLFGRTGEPFWAARMPLDQSEIPLLSEALDLIEAAEASHAKPFVAHDEHGRFVVGAIDAAEDLYVVLVTPDGVSAAGLDEARKDIEPHVAAIRAR